MATGLECIKMQLGKTDASGRRTSRGRQGFGFVIDADLIIAALGRHLNLDL
jgi:NADPH-dependent glutamate synthase beta subunit-like oxidoreductase